MKELFFFKKSSTDDFLGAKEAKEAKEVKEAKEAKEAV